MGGLILMGIGLCVRFIISMEEGRSRAIERTHLPPQLLIARVGIDLGICTLNGLGSWSALGCICWLRRGRRAMAIVVSEQVGIGL